MDSYNADEYVAGMEMPGRYYSFDRDGFHFIVLDGNNLYDGTSYTHYQYGNFYRPYEQRPIWIRSRWNGSKTTSPLPTSVVCSSPIKASTLI